MKYDENFKIGFIRCPKCGKLMVVKNKKYIKTKFIKGFLRVNIIIGKCDNCKHRTIKRKIKQKDIVGKRIM